MTLCEIAWGDSAVCDGPHVCAAHEEHEDAHECACGSRTLSPYLHPPYWVEE